MPTQRRIEVALLCALLAVAPALAAAPPGGVFVQGEDFTCDGQSWRVQEQVSQYAPDSALKHLAGATGGQGTATHDVQVPAAGRYLVWVRHSVMSGTGGNRGAFLLTIKQDGRALGEARFDEQPPTPEPPYIHAHVWSKAELDLPAGKLTLELSKLEPLECSGWTRYVDCVLLTTDAAYTPKVTDFQPKVWMRVTMGPTQTTPIYVHCFSDHYRDPWYAHFSLSKSGFEETVQPTGGPASFLKAGEATPWCDITPIVHEDRGVRLELRGAELYSYTQWLPSFDATLEFATAPDDAAIVKRFTRKGPAAGIIIIVPGVLNAETADQLKADYEYAAESVALAKTLPPVRFGKRPEKYPFFLGMGLRPEHYAPALREAEYRVAAQLGFNGTNDGRDALLDRLGFRHYTSLTGGWAMKDGCYAQPDRQRIREDIERTAKAWGSQPRPDYLMIMDEPSANPLSHLASCAACTEGFRAWLRDAQHLGPADLGVATWDDVKPVTEADRETSPRLYYYSQRFRMKAFADYLRLHTDEADRAWPGKPPATANFSDGAVYGANMYMMVDYFDVFRTRALSLAGSEDWSNLASTFQCGGYNVDLLRAAARVRKQPLFMYLITSYGRTPLDVKLKAYSSLGRGVNLLQSYYYGPHYVGHEGNWYLKADMYQPMSELTREFGGAEDIILQARPAPAQVAILYSTASDIWTIGQNALHGFERMHTWLALAHAQVPVEFLSEEDVAAGRLKPYQALYAFGPNLHSRAAGPVAQWVKSGGTLYISAGAAVADEFNQPARPLDEALGLARGAVTEMQRYDSPGRFLNTLQPQGEVAIGTTKAELLGTRQEITAGSGAKVLATFADGAPAAARVAAAKGTVYVSGFMPALSYVRKALVAREAVEKQARERGKGGLTDLSYNPWEYPLAERELLRLPVAGLPRPVATDRPLVEAFLLQAPKAAAVTLANYSLQPIASLTVTVRVAKRPRHVASVRQGTLKFAYAKGVLTTRLSLRDTDILKLTY